MKILKHSKLIILLSISIFIFSILGILFFTQDVLALESDLQTLLDLINNYRSSLGLSILSQSSTLNSAASWMANDMATNNYISHTDSLGRDLAKRVTDFGYVYSVIGENLAAGLSGPQLVLEGWKNSVDHNAILIDSRFQEIALGKAYNVGSLYDRYWVADFGTPFIGIIQQDTTSPMISNVQITNITSNSAIITWNTDELAYSKVDYGLTISYGISTNWTSLASKNQSLTISGLQTGTIYHFKVVSKDAAGNTSYSQDLMFTTLEAVTPTPDTSPPTINFLFPSNGATISGTVILKADAKDNIAIYIVEFYKGTDFFLGSDTASPYEYVWDTTKVPDGTYTLYAKAYDTSGNSTTSISVSVGVLNVSIIPPEPSVEKAILKGKVFDSDGKPLAGAYVIVHDVNWLTVFSALPSADDGSYLISDISPGTYLIDVYPPKNATDLISPQTQSYTFASGESISRDFTFSRISKILKGRVSDTNGVPVSDARVWAYNEITNFGASAETDSLGYYSLGLKGGTWNIGIEPKDLFNIRWSYNKPPVKVTFTDDAVSEIIVQNFTVTKTDAFVRGQIRLPDGTAPDPKKIFMKLWSTLGYEVHVQLSSTGFFNAAVPAASYEINIWIDDPTLKAPKIGSFSVSSGATYDLGIITLIRAAEHIKGTVKDKAGLAVSNIRITAWIPEGKGYAETFTNSFGEYDLLVSPGTWDVWVDIGSNLNYSYPGAPKRVTVTTGTTIIGVDFLLTLADATISGKVVDSSGKLLEDFYGFAFALSSTAIYEFKGGGPVERGLFSFKIPAGTYKIGVDVPPGSSWGGAGEQLVSAGPGAIVSVTISLKKNDVTIQGVIKDTNGNKITGVNFEVFASSEGGMWQRAISDISSASYKMQVTAGKWYLGIHVDPSSGYVSKKEPVSLSLSSGETFTYDFILTRATATLNILVKDPDGKVFPNVWVSVDRVSYSVKRETTIITEAFSDIFVNGGSTDSQGKLSLKVPAGTFYIHTFYQSEKGFISPEEQKVIISEDETVPLTLQFRRADLIISGRVLLNSLGTEAFVWAWSEKGGYSEARSSSSGDYLLSVSANDTWHIGAKKQLSSGELYSSHELIVAIENVGISGQNINLVKSSLTLTDSKSQSYDVTNFQTISLLDGVKVSIPANALGTAGNFTVTVTPEAELPNQGVYKVVGVGYNIEARDETGQLVNKLNSEIIIKLPYTDVALKEADISAQYLTASFWDETMSSWKVIENTVNDKTNKVVTASVNHLTRFALVAPAVAAEAPPGTPAEEVPRLEEVTPAASLKRGDLIKGPDERKVYVINAHGYKRHILNPQIFNMYGHFRWSNIKRVDQITLDFYKTSNLLRAYSETRVYLVEKDIKRGIFIKRWIDMRPNEFEVAGYDWKQIFTINQKEKNYYQEGLSIRP